RKHAHRDLLARATIPGDERRSAEHYRAVAHGWRHGLGRRREQSELWAELLRGGYSAGRDSTVHLVPDPPRWHEQSGDVVWPARRRFPFSASAAPSSSKCSSVLGPPAFAIFSVRRNAKRLAFSSSTKSTPSAATVAITSAVTTSASKPSISSSWKWMASTRRP